MGEVSELKTSKHSGNEIVIECLESALERARDGEFVSVCIVTENGKGGCDWIKGGLYSTASMVGALELAKIAVAGDECDG